MAWVKITAEMLAREIAATDWDAVDRRTDAAIRRDVAADPDAPPLLSEGELVAALARTVRAQLGLSQTAFARRFHVPLGTLRDWEQGRRRPEATALAYLRVISRAPDVVARALVA